MPRFSATRSCRLLLALVAGCGTLLGEAPEPTDLGEFEKHIRPFLETHCVKCHGPDKQKADLTVHDIDGLVTDGKDIERWEKVLEFVSLGDMPPEEKPQPSQLEKNQFTAWVARELEKIGRGQDEAKLALPHQANRLDHDSLFSGEHKGPAYSPARLWRKSPQVYKRFSNEMRMQVAQPLLGLGGKGIQDYASLVADESTIKTMLRNSKLIAAMMVSPERTHINRHLNTLFKEGADPKEEDIERALVQLFVQFFQREPTADDRARYIDGLFKENRELGGLELGFRTLITAMLMSQEFVFRMEIGLGEELPDGRRMLSPTELAYALSFAFYDKPDESLLKAAKEGRLVTREDVEREVRRILDTPDEKKRYWHYPMYHRWGEDYYHHRPRVLRFFQEFFGYTAVADVFKDRERNPEHHANRLRKDADFLVLGILERDRDVLKELLTTNRYPMDYIHEDRMKRLFDRENNQYRGIRERYGDRFEEIKKGGKWPGIDSRHVSAYNLDQETADAVRRGAGEPVVLPKDQRAGMLTHPAWLVAHSGNFDTDPIRRGKWIREHLLADLVPDVPIGVDAKVPEDPHKTLRERMVIVEAEECWRCHRKMNPLGVPFEAYNDFGQYREQIVLGDADAYFKEKRKYEGEVRKTEEDLRKWLTLDPAEKVTEAEKQLAALKKPDKSVENYTAQLRNYENAVKRWTKERENWAATTEEHRQQKVAGYRKRLSELKAPVPKAVPVDTTGVLTGTGDPALDGPVEDAIDLVHRLAKSDLARQSFVRHTFRYWMGRNETLDDSPTLIAADRAYVEGGGSFKELLVSLLTSDSFLYRK